jgi:hypothetical protein
MIKTVVTPQKNSYSLTIPAHYIGRKIEILLYALDEISEEKTTPKKSMADFSGILSDNEYQALKAHTEQARKEWNRNI